MVRRVCVAISCRVECKLKAVDANKIQNTKILAQGAPGIQMHTHQCM
jgi:hypothetical protein